MSGAVEVKHGDGATATGGVFRPFAGAVIAAFGGPFAPVLLAAINSRRLGRLKLERPIIVFALLFAIGVVVGLSSLALHASQLNLPVSKRSLMWAGPIVSVGTWLVLARLGDRLASRAAPRLGGWALGFQGFLVVLSAQLFQFAITAAVTLLSR